MSDKFGLKSGETTGSPQMDALIVCAEKLLCGSASIEELKTSILALKHKFESIISFYSHESRYQERTDEFLQEAGIIEDNFVSIRNNIGLIENYIDTKDEIALVEGINGCIISFRVLFDAFDRLKNLEKERKIYSRSPYVNEVMRVADCFIRGTLDEEAFAERLESLIRLQESFLMNLNNMKPTEEEQKVLYMNMGKVKMALKQMLDGLYEARLFFEDGNTSHIINGLEKSSQSADFLVEIEEKLNEAREAPKIKYCIRCNAENPKSVKFCINCNFNFPQLEAEEAPALDIIASEEGVLQTKHVMTQNLMRLYIAVQDVRQERIGIDEFLDVVEWFQGLVSRSKEKAVKIKDPAAPPSPNEQEAYEDFKSSFRAGIEMIESGIDELLNYAEVREPDLLDSGMEKIFSGGDNLFKVQMTGAHMRYAMTQQRNAPRPHPPAPG